MACEAPNTIAGHLSLIVCCQTIGFTTSALVPTNCCANAGEYSAERLRELKANTAQLPASKVDKAAVKAASTAVFKLSGSFKKPGAPQDDRFEPLIEPVSSAPLIPAGDIHLSVHFAGGFFGKEGRVLADNGMGHA